jgi:TIR domain-containing protein
MSSPAWYRSSAKGEIVRVFISYRRNDSAGHVPELARMLQKSLVAGEACEIFMDVQDISPGRDFVDAMSAALDSTDVVLAVIGRHWLVTDGVRRLDEPTDNVRLELRTAIGTKTPLIAVLVDRGVLPSASEIPADIRGVTEARCIPVRDDTFDDDVGRLISAIAGFERRPGRAPAPAVLRLVNEGSGWLTSGDQYNVHVDGKNLGVLITGKAPTEFILSPGDHSVKLRRGLRSSEPVSVTLRPGHTTPLGYECGVWKISLRPVTAP